MTIISMKYKQWKSEEKCLCDLSNGDFFQFPRESRLYRRLHPRGSMALVLNMENLEPETYDLSTVVNKIKVKEVSINVEFESE